MIFLKLLLGLAIIAIIVFNIVKGFTPNTVNNEVKNIEHSI